MQDPLALTEYSGPIVIDVRVAAGKEILAPQLGSSDLFEKTYQNYVHGRVYWEENNSSNSSHCFLLANNTQILDGKIPVRATTYSKYSCLNLNQSIEQNQSPHNITGAQSAARKFQQKAIEDIDIDSLDTNAMKHYHKLDSISERAYRKISRILRLEGRIFATLEAQQLPSSLDFSKNCGLIYTKEQCLAIKKAEVLKVKIEAVKRRLENNFRRIKTLRGKLGKETTWDLNILNPYFKIQ